MKTSRYLRMRREAIGFAVGSTFFFIGPLPFYADAVGVVVDNLTFFIGSIFFTTAALLQLLLAGRRPPWKTTTTGDAFDWWAATIQFIGTLLFNISTFRAWQAAIDTPDAVGVGWTADAWGSVAFLVASVLALGALRRAHELWDINARTPLAVWFGMAGSVAFGFSAVGAYIVPATDTLANLTWVNVGTSLGAVCFFIAAVVTRPGVMQEESEPAAATS